MLWIAFLLVLTVNCGIFDQFSRNVQFLHRMITEGLSVDKTTTDVLFINFKLPEFVDLLDSLLQRLRRYSESTLFTSIIDARSPHGRTRQIIIIATPDKPTLRLNYIKYFSIRSISASEQLESSDNKHVIIVTTSTGSLRLMIAITLGCFKTFNFLVLVYSERAGYNFALGKNRVIEVTNWNAPFSTVLANRRYESHPTRPYVFGAILRAPWVELQGDRFKGLDVTVFETIMNHMGQKHNIIIIETGDVNTTAYTIDEMFYSEKIDAYINRNGFPSDWAVPMMIPHTDGLCLMVPKQQSRYLFNHLLKPFQVSSWVVFCCFLLFIGVVSAVWNNLFHQNLILTLFCGSSYSHYSMRRLERFLLVGSSCLLTVLFEAYLVKFIAHMTTYQYVRDPVTVDEFMKSPGELLVHELTVSGILEARKDLEPKMTIAPAMTFDITNLTYGYILSCATAKSLLARKAEEDWQTFGRNVRPTYHLIPEKLQVSHSHYAFAHGVLCYAAFKLYYSWLFDSGLIDYWERGAELKISVPPGYVFTESMVLDLERLQLVWVVYGIGIAVSSAVLILELIVRGVVVWTIVEFILRSVALA